MGLRHGMEVGHSPIQKIGVVLTESLQLCPPMVNSAAFGNNSGVHYDILLERRH